MVTEEGRSISIRRRAKTASALVAREAQRFHPFAIEGIVLSRRGAGDQVDRQGHGDLPTPDSSVQDSFSI